MSKKIQLKDSYLIGVISDTHGRLPPSVLKVFLDSKASFVHQRMVPRAQQHEIVGTGFTTVRPVLNMVTV